MDLPEERHEAVVVARPPEYREAAQASPLARVFPVAMIVAALGMVAVYLSSGLATRNPMFALFPVMMVMSAVGSLVVTSRGAHHAAELDQDRRKYLRYLDDLDELLALRGASQRDAALRRHPDPAALWSVVDGPQLWERTSADDDFGCVRIALGDAALEPGVVPPVVDGAETRDPVTFDAMDRVLAERPSVAGMPRTVAILGQPLVVVEGTPDSARAAMRAVLCQLAVGHAPAEVAVCAVVDPVFREHWDWLKWLPHHARVDACDDLGPSRMTYARISELPPRRSGVVVVLLDGGVADAVPPEHVTVVSIGRPAGALAGLLPSVVIDAAGPVDALSLADAEVCARRLARYLASPTSPAATEGSGWAGLVGVGDPAGIAPERVWRPRAAHQRLRVPIGRDEGGGTVELDVKEAAHGGMGPHGLCVGATGSGKSEFLRTLALGLVATHAPDVLNLVLVDFKGGATFLGLERLSHVAAVITNLADEARLVDRMRDALSGELTRRQELLRAAGNFANAAEYDAARARDAEMPPLPTLLIVVDEFSELLSQHPDFIEMFVAIGRLGRSLGMHLLLASQRLEEGRLRGLETHLSYRICLKTFSASESRAVLGSGAAFELPNTPGAAYLKTASGDMVRFDAAYVSGPVQGLVPAASGCEVATAVPFLALPAGQVRVDHAQPARVAPTVLDTVVGRLAGRGTPAHQVWIPPLDHAPPLCAVLGAVGAGVRLVVPIGVIDDPFLQRREPLLVDLRGAGGNVAVVGGPHSGKSTALQTLVLALASRHDPADVHCYGIDFGRGALAALGGLPHVGAVAGRYEREMVGRILARVNDVVRQREQRRRSGAPTAPEPAVVLVIDGWAVARHEIDGLEDAVTRIATQGLSVGVHVVIATSRWAELRPALRDQLGSRIELRLGDPAESELDRKRARMLADRPAGHGIARDGRELVVALPRLDGGATPDDVAAAVASAVSTVRERHPRDSAPRVEPMPELVRRDEIDPGSAGVVLGVGEDLAPMVLDFAATPHLLMLGEGRCGKTAALRTLCRELVRVHAPTEAQLVVVDVRRTLLGVVEGDHLRGYAMSTGAAAGQLAALAGELKQRLPHDGVTQRQLRDRSWWTGPELYVVVDDYDVVVGTATNPLAPLVELLPHARDVGLHVIVARRSGGAARALFDSVLTELRQVGCIGVMMSASPEEGVLLGSVRPSALPPGRAIVSRRAAPDRLVQVAWSDVP